MKIENTIDSFLSLLMYFFICCFNLILSLHTNIEIEKIEKCFVELSG